MRSLIAWRTGPHGWSRWHVADPLDPRRTACGITLPKQCITSHRRAETPPRHACTVCWPVPMPAPGRVVGTIGEVSEALRTLEAEA